MGGDYAGPVTSWLAQRHWGLQAIAAIAFGVLTALGFQPFGWWPLTILGVAALSVIIASTKRSSWALGLGYCYGLGFLYLGVGWMQIIFVQAMVALVAFEAVFFALLGWLLRLSLKTRWWPALAAASWIIVEYSYSHFPFDGFGWMRLGYAMVDSPLAWGFPLFGVAGVGFVAALAGQLTAWLVQRPSLRRGAAVALGLAGLLLGSASGLVVMPGQSSGSVSVGWVQGGAPGGGVYGLGPARNITQNQLAETQVLMTKVNAGELAKPDFIVWPENSTDMDPGADALTGDLVQAALNVAKVPILVGTILDGPGADERQTVSLWWDPIEGVGQQYVKRGIVPFGEWVPLRELLLPLIPELKYVGAQSVAGTEPGVLSPTLANGQTVKLGVIVCYDLAFDQIVADTVTHGAQALIVQSSNAMYQGTGQIDQQFAITRARSMELRREMLVVTTSGVSGMINTDGSVAFRTTDHHSASGVVSMPLREGTTFAAAYGPVIEGGIAVLGLLGLAGAFLYGRMAKSKIESGAKHG